MGIKDALTYFLHKAVVSAIRLVLRFAWGKFRTNHDYTLRIPSRNAGRTIPCNFYKSRTGTSPTPVLINCNGSGFMFPVLGSDSDFFNRLQAQTSFAVIDVDYRLAPEYRYPAAINDINDVVRYVLARPEDYDKEHICISGFSAGGTLSLSAAALAPRGSIRSVFSFYGCADLTLDSKDRIPPVPNKHAPPVWLSNILNGIYVPHQEDRRQVGCSPAFAAPEDFPRNVLIVTCAMDIFAPECEALGERIATDRTKSVVCRRYMVPHAFDKQRDDEFKREKDESYQEAIDFLKL